MMKKILSLFSIAVLALSCNRIDAVNNLDDEIKVDLSISTSSMELDAMNTKADVPLDPLYENTISNLWLLQYADDGRLLKREYIELDYSPMSLSLDASFKKSPNSTIVVIANMGGVNLYDSEWPSSADFHWGAHSGGSLYHLHKKLFSYNLSEHGEAHLFMVGVSILAIDEDEQQNHVNMILSRLACKCIVSVRKADESVSYSNVRASLLNCPATFSIFPEEMEFDQTGDLADSPADPLQSLGTTSFHRCYFYSYENLSSDEEKQTKIRIDAEKDGHPVSCVIPVSKYGITLRNTCYEVQITLK